MNRLSRRNRLAGAAAGLLAASVVLSGCASGGTAAADLHTQDSHGFHGAALDEPYAMPAASFTRTDGTAYTLTTDATHPVTLLFFGYTHCPDLCNVVLANVASALRRSPQAVRDKVQLVFVTTDPKRDSAKVVRDYLDRFDPAFVGLTGQMAQVRSAAGTVHIAIAGTEPDGKGGYEVLHGTQLVGFAADRKAHVVWPDDISVGDLAADFARLASGQV
jgi:protein SCO1/2